ncbi:hypothetical protein [Thalassotalea fusca]
MKATYLNHSKYLFLLFLVYSVFSLTNRPDLTISLTDIVVGAVLPFLPVWLSFFVAKRFDADIKGSALNIFTLTIPALVVVAETYLIFTNSLSVNGTGAGLLGAFGAGTLIFFVAFGISLILVLFVNGKKEKLTS